MWENYQRVESETDSESEQLVSRSLRLGAKQLKLIALLLLHRSMYLFSAKK